MSDFTAGGAWVDVRPRFDSFDRDLRAGVDAGLARLRAEVEKTGEAIENSIAEAANTAQYDLKTLADGSVWVDVREEARQTGEQIEDALAEAATSGKESIRDLDDRAVWDGITGKAQRTGERIEDAMAEASRTSRRHLGLITGAIGGLGTLLAGAGLGAGIGFAVNQAADLGESVNAISVVLGDAADSFLRFGETADTQLGIAQSALNQSLIPMGSLLRNSGIEGEALSQQLQALATRATDVGSVMNKDVNEVLLAMSAAARGEQEPIRALGVSFNDAAVQAKALELGLVGASGEVSEAAKVQARLALIMEQTDQHAGDFLNTVDSLPNRIKQLKATGTELAQSFGSALLPALQGVAGGLAELLQGMGPTLERLGGAVGDALGPLFEALGPTIEGLLSGLIPIIENVSSAVGSLAPLLGPVVQMFTGFAGVLSGAFATGAEALAPALQTIVGAISGGLSQVLPVIVGLFERAAPIIGQIAGVFAELVSGALPILVGLFESLAPVLGTVADVFGEVFGELAATLLPQITSLFEELAPSIQQIAEILGGAIAQAVREVLPVMADALLEVWEAVEPLVPLLVDGLLFALETLEPILPEIVKALLAWKGATVILSAATKVMAGVQAALNLVMSANPIVLVVAALAALAAGVYIAYQRSETFRNIVDRVWEVLRGVGEYIASAAVPVWDSLRGAFDTVRGSADEISSAMTWLWDNVLVPIGEWLVDVAPVAWGALKAGMDAVVTAATAVYDAALILWNDVLVPLGAFLVDAGVAAWAAIQVAIDVARVAFDALYTAGKALWDNLLAPLTDFLIANLKLAWTVIKTEIDVVKAAVDILYSAFQVLWDNVLGPLASFLGDVLGVAFRVLWDEILSPLATFLTDTLGDAWDVVREAVELLEGGVDVLYWALKFLWDNILSPINTFILTVLKGTIEGLTTVVDLLEEAVDGAGTAFTNVKSYAEDLIGWFGSVGNAGVDTAKAAWDRFKAPLEAVVGFLDSIISKAQRAIDLLDQVNPLNVLGFGGDEGRWPQGANGMIIPRRTFLEAGEAGAEVLVPMTRPRRALELLEMSGMADLVRGQGAGLVVQFNGGQTIQDATDIDRVSQATWAAYQLRRTA